MLAHQKAMSIFFGAVIFLSLASEAYSSTLFADDFESYASGTNVNGQGGWYSNSPSYQLIAKPVSELGSQAIDGRQSILGIHWMSHALPAIDPDAITTLSFDGYAFNGPPLSTNSGVGLQSNTSNLLAGLAIWWDINHESGGWSLDVRTLTGNILDRFTFIGHWEEKANFKLVLDGTSNEVFGIANFGGSDLYTPRYAIADDQIAGLTTLTIFEDYQANISRQGAAFDNVEVTSAVPEPSTYLMLLLGFAGLLVTSRLSSKIGDLV